MRVRPGGVGTLSDMFHTAWMQINAVRLLGRVDDVHDNIRHKLHSNARQT